MNAVTGRVRPMRADDLAYVLSWRNHPEVRGNMFTQDVITWDAHQSWFERMSDSAHTHLLIYEEAGEPLGFMSLVEKPGQKVGEWGFYTAPHASRGTGSTMGSATVQYVFESLGWHRLMGLTLASNLRSIRMHTKLGFRLEGTMREHFFDGRHHVDVCLFGLLKNESPLTPTESK